MIKKETHGTFDDILVNAKPELRPVCESLRFLIASLHKGFVEVVWASQKIASFGVGPKKISVVVALPNQSVEPTGLSSKASNATRHFGSQTLNFGFLSLTPGTQQIAPVLFHVNLRTFVAKPKGPSLWEARRSLPLTSKMITSSLCHAVSIVLIKVASLTAQRFFCPANPVILSVRSARGGCW